MKNLLPHRYFDRLFLFLGCFMLITLMGVSLSGSMFIRAQKLLILAGCFGIVFMLAQMLVSVIVVMVKDFFENTKNK